MNEERDTSISLIEYRLDRFEASFANNFSLLTEKLDTVITKMNDSEIRQENLKTRLEKLEESFNKREEEINSLKLEITNLKVSFAEKLSWGAGGGAAISIVIKLLESLAK